MQQTGDWIIHLSRKKCEYRNAILFWILWIMSSLNWWILIFAWILCIFLIMDSPYNPEHYSKMKRLPDISETVLPIIGMKLIRINGIINKILNSIFFNSSYAYYSFFKKSSIIHRFFRKFLFLINADIPLIKRCCNYTSENYKCKITNQPAQEEIVLSSVIK